MITFRVNSDVRDIKVDTLTNNYLKTVSEMVRSDIEKNLRTERVLSDEIGGEYGRPAPYKVNAKGISPYRIWKLRNLGHATMFYKEGKLINSVRTKKISNGFRVYLREQRSDIGYWLNYGTYKMPQRRFFGVSKSLIEQMERDFKEYKVA